MDTKVEHGLSCNVLNADEFMNASPTIRHLVKMYLDTVHDKYDADTIMNIMSIAVDQPTFFIFLAEKNGVGVGLMTAHAVNIDSKAGGMLHIGVVDKNLSRAESVQVIDEAMRYLFEWAEKNNMPSIFTQTQRNEKAFDRLLMKYGWKRITTVYEREVSHDGRYKENNSQSN